MALDHGSVRHRPIFKLVFLVFALSCLSAAARSARADAISDWENTYAPPQPTSDRGEDALDARRKVDNRLAEWEHRDLRRSREMQARAQQLHVLESDMARTRANLDDASQRMEYWAGKVKERRQNQEPGWFSYWFSTPADRKELNDATREYNRDKDELNKDARDITRLRGELGDVGRYAGGQVGEAGNFQREIYSRSAPLLRSPSSADREYGWGARMQAGYAYQRARDLSVDANFLIKDMGTLQMQYQLTQSQLGYLQESIGRTLDTSILGGYIRGQIQRDVDAGCDLRQTRCAIKGAQGFGDFLSGPKGGSCDELQPPPPVDPGQFSSFGKGKGGGSEPPLLDPKGGPKGKGFLRQSETPPPLPPRAPAGQGLTLPVVPDAPPAVSNERTVS